MTIEQLEAEAMKLTPEERERLGEKLLGSVSHNREFEAEWAEEIFHDQYRICFHWTEHGAEDVEIVDYH